MSYTTYELIHQPAKTESKMPREIKHSRLAPYISHDTDSKKTRSSVGRQTGQTHGVKSPRPHEENTVLSLKIVYTNTST